MFDEIWGSFPPLTKSNTSPSDWQFFQSLPVEYREFLASHNGGFVEEFRYTFLTGIPFKTAQVDNPSRDDCPVEFFGIPTTHAPGDSPAGLLEQAETHASEQFLPSNVLAIARCVQNSLVCVSLRAEDMGAIFYWDWYWRYPWCKAFFEERISRARASFKDADLIINDPAHPEHRALIDALNDATLVKVAPSFSAWFEACVDRRDEDEEE